MWTEDTGEGMDITYLHVCGPWGGEGRHGREQRQPAASKGSGLWLSRQGQVVATTGHKNWDLYLCFLW